MKPTRTVFRQSPSEKKNSIKPFGLIWPSRSFEYDFINWLRAQATKLTDEHLLISCLAFFEKGAKNFGCKERSSLLNIIFFYLCRSVPYSSLITLGLVVGEKIICLCIVLIEVCQSSSYHSKVNFSTVRVGWHFFCSPGICKLFNFILAQVSIRDSTEIELEKVRLLLTLHNFA